VCGGCTGNSDTPRPEADVFNRPSKNVENARHKTAGPKNETQTYKELKKLENAAQNAGRKNAKQKKQETLYLLQ